MVAKMLPVLDPLTLSFATAIVDGDVAGLAALLAEHPTLATERFGDETESRSALHLATDWPGNFSNVGESIALLVEHGAPLDARMSEPAGETPLHWAASSDDVEALDALLDAGADIEVTGAVLTGGTPLSDAVVFQNWKVANRLVERGARMTIWQAAALGQLDEVVTQLRDDELTTADITNACWHACRAGQLDPARALVALGADLDWLGHDDTTPRQAGLDSDNPDLVAWLRSID